MYRRDRYRTGECTRVQYVQYNKMIAIAFICSSSPRSKASAGPAGRAHAYTSSTRDTVSRSVGRRLPGPRISHDRSVVGSGRSRRETGDPYPPACALALGAQRRPVEAAVGLERLARDVGVLCVRRAVVDLDVGSRSTTTARAPAASASGSGQSRGRTPEPSPPCDGGGRPRARSVVEWRTDAGALFLLVGPFAGARRDGGPQQI